MADAKLSELTELAVAPAVDDELYIRDISEAAATESKRIVIANLFATPTITSPTINGTITTTGLTLPAVTLGGNITFSGAQVVYTGSQPFRISTTMTSTDGLNVTGVNSVAYGARLILDHERASPYSQVNDIPASIGFRCRDSNGTQTEIGAFDMQVTAIHNDWVEAKYIWYTYIAGSETNALELSKEGYLQLRDTAAINTSIVDDDYYTLGAVDNDTNTITEVARVTGAATPTFDIVLGRLTGTLNANTQAITTVNGITMVSEKGVMAAASGWTGIGAGTINDASSPWIEMFGTTGGIGADGVIRIQTGNVAGASGNHGRLEIYTGGNTLRVDITRAGLVEWQSGATHTGIVLGGNMTVTGYSFVGALNSDTGFEKSGTQVVGAQGAAVADATDAPSVILRLNDLLARCRAHGLIAT